MNVVTQVQTRVIVNSVRLSVCSMVIMDTRVLVLLERCFMLTATSAPVKLRFSRLLMKVV